MTIACALEKCLLSWVCFIHFNLVKLVNRVFQIIYVFFLFLYLVLSKDERIALKPQTSFCLFNLINFGLYLSSTIQNLFMISLSSWCVDILYMSFFISNHIFYLEISDSNAIISFFLTLTFCLHSFMFILSVFYI